MPTYPVIPITQYYDNATEYDPRAAKVELGKGGVLDRSRIHFFNNTRKSYSISAVLKEKDTLQNFLELNRGKPFEFRYDGANSAGLYICKTWSWDWVVYVDGVGGVWNFSATFEQVFRPGWVSTSTGLGTINLQNILISGNGIVTDNPIGSGSLVCDVFNLTSAGQIIPNIESTGNLILSNMTISGIGNLVNSGNGSLDLITFNVSGTGTVGSSIRTTENTGIRLTEGDNIRITEAGSSPITNFRLTENSKVRTTENNDIRITEAG